MREMKAVQIHIVLLERTVREYINANVLVLQLHLWRFKLLRGRGCWGKTGLSQNANRNQSHIEVER